MKFKKTDGYQLPNSFRNMHIKSKQRRHMQQNIQIGAKLLASPSNKSYKTYYRPITLKVSRFRRLSAQEEADNCSPTRAYHSDSETVVRKEKESSHKNHKNLLLENEVNLICIQADVTPTNVGQSNYHSSDSSYQLDKQQNLSGLCQITATNITNNIETAMKRFSLRESSTSIFGSNASDTTKSSSFERSPSLQHIGCSSVDISPCFRTPISSMSGNCCHMINSSTTTTRASPFSPGYSQPSHFNIGYSSDDFHLLHHNNQARTTLVTSNNGGHADATVSVNAIKRSIDPSYPSTSSSWVGSINNRYIQSANLFLYNQPNIQSLGVELPRQQNYMSNSGDSNSCMDDLSPYMDLMIHIPKNHQ